MSGTKRYTLFLIRLFRVRANGLVTLGRTTAARLWLYLSGLYFLAAAHFTFPNHGGFGLELPANPVAWMFIASWIGIGFWHWTTRKSLRYSTTTLWFMAGVLVLAIPQFYPWAATEDGAGQRLLGLLGGLLLFIATQQQPWRQDRWRSVLTLILACCAIQSGIGLIQYFLLEPGNLLGFNKTMNRPYGTFQQVNVMASFVATGLVLALYLFTAPARSCNHLTSGLALFQIFAAALLLVVIQSRTGQLAGVLGVMLLIPRLLSSGKPQTIVVLAMLALGLIAANLSREAVDQVDRPPSIYEDPGARTTIYAQSADIIREHWALGAGYGRFESAWRNEHAKQATPPGNVIGGLHALNHPHNETLFWTVEGGITALIGLLILAVGFLRSFRGYPVARIAGLLALPAPILIHTQTEYPLYHSTLHWIVLVSLLAFIDSETSRLSLVRLPRIILPAAMSVLLPLLTAIYMVSSLQATVHLTEVEASKPKDYEPLTNIWNPAAQAYRFQFHLMELRLLTALSKGDQAELKHFLKWVRKRKETQPRIPFFFNEALALQGLGQHNAAKDVLRDARYLFGNRPEFARMDELLSGGAIEILPINVISKSDSGLRLFRSKRTLLNACPFAGSPSIQQLH